MYVCMYFTIAVTLATSLFFSVFVALHGHFFPSYLFINLIQFTVLQFHYALIFLLRTNNNLKAGSAGYCFLGLPPGCSSASLTLCSCFLCQGQTDTLSPSPLPFSTYPCHPDADDSGVFIQPSLLLNTSLLSPLRHFGVYHFKIDMSKMSLIVLGKKASILDFPIFTSVFLSHWLSPLSPNICKCKGRA